MRLTLQSEKTGDVAIIRCQGRIVAGAEVDELQAELEKQTKIPGLKMLIVKKVVLQLAETDFIDSSGLGALVRMLGVLRAAGGDLKLCQLSPFVLKVLEVTNLTSVFLIYASEKEAIDAFAGGSRSSQTGQGSSKVRVVCVDTSSDLLAYLDALLKRSGYEVFSTRYAGEAMTLVNATKSTVVVCGPGMMASPIAEASLDKIRKNSPGVRIMLLPADFSTSHAGEAGVDLVSNLHNLLTASA